MSSRCLPLSTFALQWHRFPYTHPRTACAARAELAAARRRGRSATTPRAHQAPANQPPRHVLPLPRPLEAGPPMMIFLSATVQISNQIAGSPPAAPPPRRAAGNGSVKAARQRWALRWIMAVSWRTRAAERPTYKASCLPRLGARRARRSHSTRKPLLHAPRSSGSRRAACTGLLQF